MDYITGLISIWPSCARGSIPPVRGLLGNIPCPVGAEIKGQTPPSTFLLQSVIFSSTPVSIQTSSSGSHLDCIFIIHSCLLPSADRYPDATEINIVTADCAGQIICTVTSPP